MLEHYGERVGHKHARKHLGWALEAAASSAGTSVTSLKEHRARVLTAETSLEAKARLQDAFGDFAWRAAA